MESKHIWINLPMKFHRALKKKVVTGENRSKQEALKVAAMRSLIADGLVRPSKIERQMCGICED